MQLQVYLDGEQFSAGGLKMQDWKMEDQKMEDRKLQEQVLAWKMQE